MDVSQFDFDLPRESIATRPARPRDTARMLEVTSNMWRDLSVSDLPRCLRAGDLLVFNDTKVLPARLEGRREAERGTASVEITLNRAEQPGIWSAFAKPAKRLRVGDRVRFAELEAEVLERRAAGEIVFRFTGDDTALFATLERAGEIPLPPYMGRKADEADRIDYQTVFARAPGAVAAPTAALHFTPRLLEALAGAGVGRTFVTLHVGAGTFLPVMADNTDAHHMHKEWGEVPAVTADAINATRGAGGRVVAVGTTALRMIESASDKTGRLAPFRGDTDLFITPGYRFKAVDLLLTNFHLPRSTLFMLVSAFAGLDRMQQAYAHAALAGYRFYSYGDATLLHRAPA